MNKKGFTLIELLAVIVILAIIALIATPIVLNIIEDSKKSAFVQTGNGIVDAAEYYYMKEMSDGAKPTEDKVFTFDGSTNGLDGLEFDGEIPKEGTLTVDVNGKVELVAHNNQYCLTKRYNQNEITINDYNGNCKITEESVCTLVNDTDNSGTVTAGDKYQCKVDPNKEEYTFYVLSFNEDGTTNLILNNVIYNDGTVVNGYPSRDTKDSNPTQYNAVEWISQEDYNDDTNYGEYGNTNKGPITAMNFLYNATKNWTNVPALNYTYNNTVGGYTSFVSTNGVATITSSTEPVVKTTIGTVAVPLRSRMATNDDSTFNISANGGYLYENLHLGAYWLLSTAENGELIVPTHEQFGASMIDDYGMYFTSASTTNWVRPVITVEL